jgi:hypothetical protein
MSSNDAMGEPSPQKDTAPAPNEQLPPSLETHTNVETSRAVHNDAQPGIMKREVGTVVKQEITGNAPQLPLEPPLVSTNVQAASEHGDQEPRLLKQEHIKIKSEHAAQQVTRPLLPENVSQEHDAGSEAHTESSTSLAIGSGSAVTATPDHRSALPISNSHDMEDPSPAGPTSNGIDYPQNRAAPHPTETKLAEPAIKTPESLRGNPYMLSAFRDAQPYKFTQTMTEDNKPTAASRSGQQPVTTEHNIDVPGVDIGSDARAQLMCDGPQASHTIALKYSQSADQDQAQDEGGYEPLTTDGELVDESDNWSEGEEEDAEEVNEHVANMTSQLQRGVAKAKSKWEQRHEIFQDYGLEFHAPAREDDNEEKEYDEDDFSAIRKSSDNPAFNRHEASRHGQRQPASVTNTRGPAMRPLQGRVNMQQHGRPRLSSFHTPDHLPQQMPTNFFPGPSGVSGAASMQHGMYQGGMQNPQQLALYAQHDVGYQDFGYPAQPLDRYPSHIRHPPLPISPFQMPAVHLAPLASNNQSLRYQAMPAQRGVQHQNVPQGQVAEEEDEDTDDDEPLRTRVQYQQPIVRNSASRSSTPVFEPAPPRKKQAQRNDSDVEFVYSAKKRPLPKGTAMKKAPSKQPAIPQPAESQDTAQSESAPAAEIDWKLPEYEAVYTPAPTKHDPGIAKVSIPGLIREGLLLSPDHAEQEAHLLLNIFIPAQKALPTPDPAPAIAVLNFHTIAVMVIEAFVQFEIGDEFGTGRGHWHTEHDTDEGEYERLRNAKDADPDEIFFAVIDRWRAAMESGKEPAKLVRGAQEFCDIALEVVYYIKEHGLLAQRERAVRSDKEFKRGAKRVGDEEKTGAKRKVKVNEVQVRKKPKVEKPKAKEPAKRKSRAKEPGLTVVKAPARKR